MPFAAEAGDASGKQPGINTAMGRPVYPNKTSLAGALIMGLISDECRTRVRTNPLFRSMKIVEQIAEQVAAGNRKNVVVSGPTGIGKNFLFERAFKQRGKPWLPERPVSSGALIGHIKENNHPDAILPYDECDHMIRNVGMLNVLKIATDTKDSDRILSYRARTEKLSIDPFAVQCGFVFLMNTNLIDAKLLQDKRLGEHIKAFNSRCMPYVMPFNHEAMYEYTCYLVICERMLMLDGYSRDITELALAYFAETMPSVRDVSPRRIALIAKEIQRNPSHWREFLEPTLEPQWCKPPSWVPHLEPRRVSSKACLAATLHPVKSQESFAKAEQLSLGI